VAQAAGSLFIVRSVVGVLSAIQLYDQPGGHADKICDIVPDGHLATEFEAAQAAITELTPEKLLGVGLTLPQ
jgi:hypothetical protein